MIKKLLLGLFLLGAGGLTAQNLHTHPNAASLENETNTTTGWTGTAGISSVSQDPQSGSFALRAVSTNNNGRELRYSFNAVVGGDYEIRIWAKEGPEVTPNNIPAFANWTGMTGFANTPISGTAWSEYVFNVTATTTSPILRVYTSEYGSRFVAGNTVSIDGISIMPAGSDTEAPTAISDLSSSNLTFSSVDLSWSPAMDNVGVVNYEVFRNGVSIANTGNSTNLNVSDLVANTNYSFSVFAEDAAGNVSTASNTLNITTPNIVDEVPPSAITDLIASNTTSTSTSLSWSASTDNVGVTNYEVFQNGTSIENTGTNTNLVVAGLTPETSYTFTVLAEDAAGNFSAAGNTVNITTSAGQGGVVDYTSENSNLSTIDWTARDLFADRNIGIGTLDTQGYRLAVAGNVIAEGVKVELQGNWPDFVFAEEFDLIPLTDLKSFIETKGHLPNIPNAAEVQQEGIDLGGMNALLLQKIEEMTLYILNQEERINGLTLENAKIMDILNRIAKLEDPQR